jgi:hypothetical protein
MSKGKGFANELGRMSAPARLELAPARLMQTERLVHEVICLAEQRRAFLRNFHMLDWQQNRAFETLLITIFYFEIIQICRLWDPPETEGYSIPMLAAVGVDPGVLALIEDAVSASLKVTAAKKPLAVAATMSRVRQALAVIPVLAGGPELRRLRNHRHKHVAHAVLKSYLESGGAIDEPRLADAEAVLEKTLDLMTIFSSAAQSIYTDFREDQATERAVAEGFFGALAPAVHSIVRKRAN